MYATPLVTLQDATTLELARELVKRLDDAPTPAPHLNAPELWQVLRAHISYLQFTQQDNPNAGK
jgi:hypothetical protein